MGYFSDPNMCDLATKNEVLDSSAFNGLFQVVWPTLSLQRPPANRALETSLETTK